MLLSRGVRCANLESTGAIESAGLAAQFIRRVLDESPENHAASGALTSGDRAHAAAFYAQRSAVGGRSRLAACVDDHVRYLFDRCEARDQ